MVFSRSRRRFLGRCAVASSSLLVPSLCLGRIGTSRPLKRVLGRTGIQVTTLGLGGQASIQLPPADLSPVSIIQKALAKGINYIDTSNRYGPSQRRFGEAFREMHLIPGQPGYDGRRRRELFIASKSVIRYGKGSHPEVNCRTDGPDGSHTADDIRRSLSQMFGDGQGGYPQGAYLDFFFIHTLDTHLEVDAIYEGIDAPDAQAERIGALATLRDYRDGTNLTGLNPREERLIRHIGISGHEWMILVAEPLEHRVNWLPGKIHEFVVEFPGMVARQTTVTHHGIAMHSLQTAGFVDAAAFGNVRQDRDAFLLWQRCTKQRRPLAFGKPSFASPAGKHATLVVRPVVITHRQVFTPALPVVRALGILTAEPRQIVHDPPSRT